MNLVETSWLWIWQAVGSKYKYKPKKTANKFMLIVNIKLKEEEEEKTTRTILTCQKKTAAACHSFITPELSWCNFVCVLPVLLWIVFTLF